MEGTLEELRRISNCPEGATFSQLGLRKSLDCFLATVALSGSRGGVSEKAPLGHWRNARQSSMGFIPENQLRTRLPAGGNRIRTIGPPRTERPWEGPPSRSSRSRT